MSVFKIKLKTRNGNDIKKKETITVFFRMNYKHGLKVNAQYTYRIMCSSGMVDNMKVLEIKNKAKIGTIENMTLMVIVNLLHIVTNLCSKQNIDPDFIMFISPELESKNKSWTYLKDVFFRPNTAQTTEEVIKMIDGLYDEWNPKTCGKLKIDKNNLDILYNSSKAMVKTKFMFVDPNRDVGKYGKSLHICNMLKERIENSLQYG